MARLAIVLMVGGPIAIKTAVSSANEDDMTVCCSCTSCDSLNPDT